MFDYKGVETVRQLLGCRSASCACGGANIGNAARVTAAPAQSPTARILQAAAA
jgi:hypothetical protein